MPSPFNSHGNQPMNLEAHGLALNVRARESFSHRMNYYREGEVFSLDRGEAFFLLDFGRVEPVFDLEIYRPPLDLDGLTICEALFRHASDFPPLQPFLKDRNTRLSPASLYVRQFATMPMWPGVGDEGQSPEDRSQKSLRLYLWRVAIHFFFKRLVDEELNASGVAESDLKTFKVSPIHPGWWQRNILVDFSRDEIWESMAHGPIEKIFRFCKVHIQQPKKSQKQSRRGAPSHRDDFLKAFDHLLEIGSLTAADLKSKKGVRNKVLKHLGLSSDSRGCSYNTFVEHVALHIDEALKTRESEN